MWTSVVCVDDDVDVDVVAQCTVSMTAWMRICYIVVVEGGSPHPPLPLMSVWMRLWYETQLWMVGGGKSPHPPLPLHPRHEQKKMLIFRLPLQPRITGLAAAWRAVLRRSLIPSLSCNRHGGDLDHTRHWRRKEEKLVERKGRKMGEGLTLYRTPQEHKAEKRREGQDTRKVFCILLKT